MKKTLEHGSEVFRWVDGYYDLYQVSNYGRVKSTSKNKLTRWGLRRMKERFLKTNTFHPSGYRFVTLIKNGVRTSHAIHRLVAFAFIPNPQNKPQINHKDTLKDNNVASNLEWCDNSYNQIHAFKNGLNKPKIGEEHPRSKINENQVLKIRKLRMKTKLTNRQIGDKFGITKHHVWQIVNHITWNHI